VQQDHDHEPVGGVAVHAADDLTVRHVHREELYGGVRLVERRSVVEEQEDPRQDQHGEEQVGETAGIVQRVEIVRVHPCHDGVQPKRGCEQPAEQPSIHP
jgi:hypothetical protein